MAGRYTSVGRDPAAAEIARRADAFQCQLPRARWRDSLIFLEKERRPSRESRGTRRPSARQRADGHGPQSRHAVHQSHGVSRNARPMKTFVPCSFTLILCSGRGRGSSRRGCRFVMLDAATKRRRHQPRAAGWVRRAWQPGPTWSSCAREGGRPSERADADAHTQALPSKPFPAFFHPSHGHFPFSDPHTLRFSPNSLQKQRGWFVSSARESQSRESAATRHLQILEGACREHAV